MSEIDNTKVICPECCHQFRAIPVQVQELMIGAGLEPPFHAPAQAVQGVTEEEAHRFFEASGLMATHALRRYPEGDYRELATQYHWRGFRAALRLSTPAAQGTCDWKEEDPYGDMPGTYTSVCGALSSFADGGPAESGVWFCYGCGKPVNAVPFPAAPEGEKQHDA